ncbi:MAG: LLM class flavin-dependent oxidoreductase [Actinomycetota bacterium]
MKIGLMLPMYSGDAGKARAFAEGAEELGFDGVFAYDHLFPPGHPDRPALEAFTTLAAVAVATGRISIGTLVTRAGLRHPGMLAKLAASIDHMSGGRMILGIGTGDRNDELEVEAFGLPSLPMDQRRVQLSETIDAVKSLFRGNRYAGGNHVPAMTGPLAPPPSTAGGPPVWVGGKSDALVRIAAERGDGWNAWGASAEEFAEKSRDMLTWGAGRQIETSWSGIAVIGEDDEEAARLQEKRHAKGFGDDGVWAGSVDGFVVFVESLRGAGCSWVIAVPAGPPDRVELVANAVLPRIAVNK